MVDHVDAIKKTAIVETKYNIQSLDKNSKNIISTSQNTAIFGNISIHYPHSTSLIIFCQQCTQPK